MFNFDPAQRCWVHDKSQDRIIAWWSGWADQFKSIATISAYGLVHWDELLLDGWWPWETWPPDGDL